MFDKIKEKKSRVGILTLLILVAILAILFFKLNSGVAMNSNYIIPGVPYYGIQNHYRGYLGNTENSVFSVVEYWQPGLIESAKIKNGTMDVNSLSSAFTFLNQNGFSVKTRKLSIADLNEYINPSIRTPLLVYLPVSSDEPDTIIYYQMAVLIGNNEKEKKLTLHDYWLGNNYEVSYDQFNELQSKLPASQRNSYIIIQPNNLEEKIKEVSQRNMADYPARTLVMQKGEDMFKNYAIGTLAYNLKLYTTAREYFLKVEEDPNFNEYLPPYFKVTMAGKIGWVYYIENNLDSALAYAQKAEAVNHDLNQPFKDWPGIIVDWRSGDQAKLSDSYVLFGDIYRQRKDLQGAKDSYAKALEVAPNSVNAKDGMDIIDALSEAK